MEDIQIKEENNVINNEQTTESNNDYKENNVILQKELEKVEKESILSLKYAVPIITCNLLLVIVMAILLFTTYSSLKEANNKIVDLTVEVESIKKLQVMCRI